MPFSKRSKGFLFVALPLLIAILIPLPASIQTGFPVITRSGNTTKYVTTTGTLTSGHSPFWDANGNIIDSGGIAPNTTATVDLATQQASITPTALFTPTATGMFRVSYYAKVTTISAGGTSILGGTTGLVLTFTDGTDSVAQTAFTLPEDNQAGTALSVGTGNTTNTTQATLTGAATFWAKTGVGITYAFGYSTTVGTMQYELHIKIEAM